ncbi:MAG: hypothetical protein ACK4KT_08165 [Thermaurantimonas sp.]
MDKEIENKKDLPVWQALDLKIALVCLVYMVCTTSMTCLVSEGVMMMVDVVHISHEANIDKRGVIAEIGYSFFGIKNHGFLNA